MEHGSFEWHEWRDKHANASEAAAVMDCGRFVPRNRRELSMLRNGQLSIPKTFPMLQGQKREAGVVAMAGTCTGQSLFDGMFQPKVLSAVVDGVPMSASLDGVYGDTWVEVKVVVSDKSSYWTEAGKGRIDESVLWQMTQQMIVAREHGIVNGFLIVQDASGKLTRTVPYAHDGDREDSLVACWKALWPYIEKGEVFGERLDAPWKMAAEAYLSAKQAKDEAEERMDKAKKILVELAQGQATVGYGVQLIPVVRSGSPDYSKLPPGAADALPKKADVEYMMVKETK